MIGLSGASLGYYATSEEAKAKITTKVEVKYLGLYRRENINYDRNDIKTFLEYNLNITTKSGKSQLYQKGIGEILGNQMENDVPGVIIYFKTKKATTPDTQGHKGLNVLFVSCFFLTSILIRVSLFRYFFYVAIKKED